MRLPYKRSPKIGQPRTGLNANLVHAAGFQLNFQPGTVPCCHPVPVMQDACCAAGDRLKPPPRGLRQDFSASNRSMFPRGATFPSTNAQYTFPRGAVRIVATVCGPLFWFWPVRWLPTPVDRADGAIQVNFSAPPTSISERACNHDRLAIPTNRRRAVLASTIRRVCSRRDSVRLRTEFPVGRRIRVDIAGQQKSPGTAVPGLCVIKWKRIKPAPRSAAQMAFGIHATSFRWLSRCR